jgi:hypothetical protein
MMSDPSPTLVRQRSFRDILDEAIGLSRRHALRMVPSVAVPMAVALFLMTVAQLGFTMMPGTVDPETGFGSMFAGMIGFFAAFVLYLVVVAAGTTALAGAAMWQVLDQPRSMGRAWLWAVSPKVLGTSVLLGLTMGAGFVMCMLPGIILGLMFGLTVFVMASETVFGPAAMGRSWELVNHNPGGRLASHPALKVFVIGFVGYLLSYLSSMVVQLPFGIVQQALMLRSLTDVTDPSAIRIPTAVWWLQVPQSILGAIAMVLVTIYMAFCAALLTVDLGSAKEGGDLEAVLDELGAPRLPEIDAPA